MKKYLAVLLLILVWTSPCHALWSPARGAGVGAAASAPTYFGASASCSTPCATTDSSSPVTITPPADMVAGDLVVVIIMNSINAAPSLTVSTDGGQTWAAGTLRATYNSIRYYQLHYCTFDGTWDASPQFSTNQSSGTGFYAVMYVFRPGSTPHTWAIDTAEAETNYAAPADPYDVTISEITTTNANSVVLFSWVAEDDITYTLQTAGFENAGGAYHINTGGNDMTVSSAYKIMASPGGTGSSTNRQGSGNLPDPGSYITIAFY